MLHCQEVPEAGGTSEPVRWVIIEPECQMVEILHEERLKAVLIMSVFGMVYHSKQFVYVNSIIISSLTMKKLRHGEI